MLLELHYDSDVLVVGLHAYIVHRYGFLEPTQVTMVNGFMHYSAEALSQCRVYYLGLPR